MTALDSGRTVTDDPAAGQVAGDSARPATLVTDVVADGFEVASVRVYLVGVDPGRPLEALAGAALLGWRPREESGERRGEKRRERREEKGMQRGEKRWERRETVGEERRGGRGEKRKR